MEHTLQAPVSDFRGAHGMNAGCDGNRDAFAEFYFGAEASDNVLVGEDFVFSVLHHRAICPFISATMFRLKCLFALYPADISTPSIIEIFTVYFPAVAQFR